jgi:TrmH family RNA methyltransferase
VAASVRSRSDFWQRLESLKRSRLKRRQAGCCFVESVVALESALRSGHAILALTYDESRPLSTWASGILDRCPDAEIRPMASTLLAELSDREETSELLALVAIRVRLPAELPIRSPALVVLLDRPSSPGNLGSILRSADAFGADALVIRGHAADIWDPQSIRSSLGAVFTVPVAQDVSNEDLERWIESLRRSQPDLQVVGASPDAGTAPWGIDFRKPTLLALGNERQGMSEWLRGAAELSVGIPTGGSVDSLNLASAASILLYEVGR